MKADKLHKHMDFMMNQLGNMVTPMYGLTLQIFLITFL